MAVCITPCPAPSSRLSSSSSSSLSALLGNCEASACIDRVQEEPLSQLLPLWKILRRREELSSRFGIDSAHHIDSLIDGQSPSLSQAYHLLDGRVHREYSAVCTHFDELLSSYCTRIADPAGVEILDFLVMRHSVCLQYGFAAHSLLEHYQRYRGKYHELFRALSRSLSSQQGKSMSKKQKQLDCARYRELHQELVQKRAEGGVLFRTERSPPFLDLAFYGSLAAAAGDVLYKSLSF